MRSGSRPRAQFGGPTRARFEPKRLPKPTPWRRAPSSASRSSRCCWWTSTPPVQAASRPPARRRRQRPNESRGGRRSDVLKAIGLPGAAVLRQHAHVLRLLVHHAEVRRRRRRLLLHGLPRAVPVQPDEMRDLRRRAAEGVPGPPRLHLVRAVLRGPPPAAAGRGVQRQRDRNVLPRRRAARWRCSLPRLAHHPEQRDLE